MKPEEFRDKYNGLLGVSDEEFLQELNKVINQREKEALRFGYKYGMQSDQRRFMINECEKAYEDYKAKKAE